MPRRSAVAAPAEPVRMAPSFAPKGLSRIEAARHIGVSTTTFDAMVNDGRMPRPKIVGARVLWDRVRLETFFDALPERGGSSDDGDSFADWQ